MKKLLLALLSFTFVTAFAQENVTGIIKDENGDPIPGATILVKGTKSYTVTDVEGNFSIPGSKGTTFYT